MASNYIFYPKRAMLLLAACFLSIITLSAQTKPPHAGFKKELGVDLSMPLHGYWGTAIVYKHWIGSPKTGKWQKRQALRGMVGLYQKDFDGTNQWFQADSVRTHTYNGQNQGLLLHAGWEIQVTKKRFRVYGGGDLGLRYIKSTTNSLHELSRNGSVLDTYTTTSESKSSIPQVSVFGGANYFLTKHLSLGVELSLPVALELESSVTLTNGLPQHYSNTTLAVGGDYFPRLLYLSWHFDSGQVSAATPQ